MKLVKGVMHFSRAETKSLLNLVCNLPPLEVWLYYGTEAQKKHWLEARTMFRFLGLSLYAYFTDKPGRLGKFLSDKDEQLVLQWRDYYLSLYSLTSVGWEFLKIAADKPSLINAKHPNGKEVKQIDFPYQTPWQVVENMIANDSDGYLCLCFSGWFTASGSRVRELYRQDHKLRETPYSPNHEEHLRYETKLKAARKEYEHFRSLYEFCIEPI